ncbi:BTAD domain-containing putative transcriptional regulator [Demequina flava]|uniref:BTAD domain-containing putative transcriptional regulator n=1 Tax=Demequina flava TaxID=1095025 RepID=UPI0009E624AD|nr:BTAD domain-containing putative transcriptional regulator [Demequina flava]
MLDVLVLGTVSASKGGRSCALGGALQKGLLARLVVARGHPVSPASLAEDLWGEDFPRDPVHALQARVSRLRTAISADIEFADGGYRLDPAEVHTDADQFEVLREDGIRLLDSGYVAEGAERLHAALDLWRGPAFLGVPEVGEVRSAGVRLERLRIATRAERIDADLALGRGPEVLPELHALVDESPFNERHWGQLMSALYSDGRANEALDVYARAREVLAEAFGAEPGSDLGSLHVGILREEPPRALLRRAVGQTTSGTGARHAPQDVAGPSGSLTSNRPDLLGGALREDRTVLLTGPAGIGKTHLLRTISAQLQGRRFSAPVLRASALSQEVPLGIFAGAGDGMPHEWTSAAALITHFSRQRSRMVLLVDNVEFLDDASLFVVTQLIRTTRIPAILTSRTLTEAPQEITALYDSGDVTSIGVEPLTNEEADELTARIVNGPVSPAARAAMLRAAQGNPLHLREVVKASLDEGRLVDNGTVWELQGEPASSARLTQLVGERCRSLTATAREGAAKLAIAGEFPDAALGQDVRRELVRAGIAESSTLGWLRLSHPLDAEVLRSQLSEALWRELMGEVLEVLLGEATAQRPVARRRAHILALDLDTVIDAHATLEVAEHALGTSDERLALRAAESVIAQAPDLADAYRVAGLAASSLGMAGDADAHLVHAAERVRSDAERASVAVACARHRGMGRHDAHGALAALADAVARVDDPEVADQLRREQMRWTAVAGLSGDPVGAPHEVSEASAVLGLITVGMSGVITGPLVEAESVLARLRRVPEATVEQVPGGASLIELTEVMALSNTGDMEATRRRLNANIVDAQARGADALGAWEYALGFTELVAGDVTQAYSLATAACAHLQWRDVAGLLPAASALAGAAASATSGSDAAHEHFAAVPEAAQGDPKVVMLRAWAQAWQANAAGEAGLASRTLVDAAQWLLAAQHSFFAGTLAHCAVRVGENVAEAATILEAAKHVGGGGLLDLLAEHAAASVSGDVSTLDSIAKDAHELGLASSAADTWLALSRVPASGRGDKPSVRDQRSAVDELFFAAPGMALWVRED